MKHAYTFNHNPLLSERLPEWRARFVLAGLLVGSLILVGRAMYLQGVNKDFLQRKGESRYARVLDLPANRGKVSDRNGETLATSTPVKSIALLPDMVQFGAPEIARLARVLEIDATEINRKLASGKDYVFLARSVPPDVAERVAALKLQGIQIQDEYRRYYPAGEMAAHLVGFTNVDDRGQEGMELAFDRSLTGKSGARRVIKDRRGAIVEDVEYIRQPLDGQNLRLSIDSKLQFIAYSALRDAVVSNKAKAGSVVVLDARTGEVLALANNPVYNPNNRVNLSGEQLRNRVMTDSFEPGSIMKPFVAAMGLESGRYSPETQINLGNGRMLIDGANIGDAHGGGGLMSVAQIIQKSSNVGVAKIALNFSPQHMWDLYDDLGFGRPLKLGFPGEVGGRLRPWKNWRPVEQATMAYGHGVSVTLMQMAHAYTVFTHNGQLLPLSLTRRDDARIEGQQIFKPEVARQVLHMMEAVVQPGGTATQAAVPGYRAAGKTGTAYKLENGRYVNRYRSSFVGIVPVSDPRLIIAVSIDEPGAGRHYGGSVAGPAFSQIAAGSLRALGVRPDAPLAPQQIAQAGAPKGPM
ncbi:MAG: penicillin-binding protein 2 [Candidatus Dactylopiibacterium sp.]|nr:penicillin-binding protein 2 [Candidatus Dactylopiibacterium sp.]